MVWVGIFRVSEPEHNERLIFPSLQTVDVNRLAGSLNELRARESGKSTKDATAFWERMLPPLRRAKQERKGLDLGALELLLAKVAKLTGPDVRLKSPIHG